MKVKALLKRNYTHGQKGFSLLELVIVLLILAIMVVLALPQIISSRRAFRFSAAQRIMATSLNEARQEAMSQRTAITFRYDDSNKKIITYGGKFGALGDARNRAGELSGSGLEAGDIIYGRPAGAPTSALADTSNLTPLVSGAAAITFQPDGSVLDASEQSAKQRAFYLQSDSATECLLRFQF